MKPASITNDQLTLLFQKVFRTSPKENDVYVYRGDWFKYVFEYQGVYRKPKSGHWIQVDSIHEGKINNPFDKSPK